MTDVTDRTAATVRLSGETTIYFYPRGGAVLEAEGHTFELLQSELERLHDVLRRRRLATGPQVAPDVLVEMMGE